MKIDIIKHIVTTGDHIEVTTYKPVGEDIVHCGECKYADPNTLFCTLHSCNPTELDFCSWGERE